MLLGDLCESHETPKNVYFLHFNGVEANTLL